MILHAGGVRNAGGDIRLSPERSGTSLERASWVSFEVVLKKVIGVGADCGALGDVLERWVGSLERDRGLIVGD